MEQSTYTRIIFHNIRIVHCVLYGTIFAIYTKTTTIILKNLHFERLYMKSIDLFVKVCQSSYNVQDVS